MEITKCIDRSTHICIQAKNDKCSRRCTFRSILNTNCETSKLGKSCIASAICHLTKLNSCEWSVEPGQVVFRFCSAWALNCWRCNFSDFEAFCTCRIHTTGIFVSVLALCQAKLGSLKAKARHDRFTCPVKYPREGPYKCDQCDLRFQDSKSKYRHSKNKHAGNCVFVMCYPERK